MVLVTSIHVGGPLDQGTVEGYEVECPWHGSKFDVRTGEPTKPPQGFQSQHTR